MGHVSTKLALFVLLGAIPLGPSQDRLQALIAKAQRAEQQQDLEEAASAYGEILRLRPHWTEAEFNLATVYYSQKKYPEAVRLFDEVIRHNPALADAYLFRGVAYYHTEQSAKALTSLKKFLSLKPENPQVHFFLGAVYYDLGDYSKAAVQYLEQVKIGLDRDRAYYHLGKAYQALAGEALKMLKGKSGEAQKVIGDAPGQEGPDCQQAKGLARGLIFAACLNASNNFSAATTALLEANRRAPGDQDVAYWSFRLYSLLGQTAYARLAVLSPSSYLVAKMHAEMLEQQGKRPEADREFQHAVELGGSDPEPLIAYGKFKDKVGQFDQAIPLFQRALALDPFNLRVAALLGEAYLMNNQPQAAIAHLDRVVRLNPKDTQSRIYLAQALESLGHLDDAIKILEQATSDEDGRIHYMLGKYYLRKGQKEEAAHAFETFRRRQRATKQP